LVILVYASLRRPDEIAAHVLPGNNCGQYWNRQQPTPMADQPPLFTQT